MEKDFGTKLESIKHIGDMVDGKLVCREDCPSVTHKTPEAEGDAYSRGYKQGRFDADTVLHTLNEYIKRNCI